ncbi:MAG: ABC transporter ATP-binding protein [Alphaproteobacteria bacterium]
MIELEHLTVAYGATAALRDVSLRVPQDETMVLLGGSGAGKSTVLKAILKLVPPAAGAIRIDGEDIAAMDSTALRRRIGMVFQGTALFPHMTVAENIALPLSLSGMKRAAARARVEELLALLALAPATYEARFPHQLSGGEAQRVGVARALASRPSYLLMDEPFGALDAITRRKLQDELKQLRRALKITILFVTHDVMEAVSLGDALAVMDRGRILQTGSAQALMDRPADDTVRALVSTPLRELKTFVRDSVS